MKKLLFLFTLSLLMVSMAWGQVNISAGATVTQDFSIGTSATAALPTGWKADKNTTVRLVGSYDSAATATERSDGNSMSTSAANGIYNFGAGPGASATDRAVGGLSSSSASKSVNLYVQLYNDGSSDITNFTISYNVEKYRNGSNSAGFSIQMYYSTNGSSWTSAGSDFLTSFSADANNNGYTSAPGATVSVSNKTLSQALAASSSLYLAWNYSVTSGATTSNAQALGVDDISITANGGAPSPLISVIGTLSPFSTTTGTASASQSYSVSGSNLTANISITAPSGFEVSTSANSGYQQSISLTQSGGSVASTTVYARLKGASAGNFSGNIAHESTGATTVNLSASGTVTDPTPIVTVNPSTLSGFTYVVDEGPSTHQTFTVSGSTLTADITVTASTNYEISEDGTTYTSPITLTQTGGEVSETTLYVRLAAGLSAGDYNNEVVIASSTGADDKSVTCNGYVSSPPPPGYFVDFEGASEEKTSYASGTVNLSGLNWDMTEALIGNLATDWKAGTKSARMRGYAASSMTMLEDVADGVGTVSFSYRRYGTDDQVDWKVEYSTDQGTSWTQLGSDFTAPATDDVQSFSEALDMSDPVRIRIKRATDDSNASNNRLNIDDISLSEYTPPYDITPGIPATYGNEGAETSITITGGGFVGANIISEGLTPAANAAFITSSAGILQLIGTGSVTLSFTPAAGDTWFTYSISGGDWVVIDLTHSETVIPIEIIVDLGSKDAAFEFKSGTGGDPTLPVELSTFTVALNNYNNAVLTWVTQTETGVSGFYVFRNTEESLATAEMVSNLIPATNTSQQQVYLFTDKELGGPGTYYYWLQVSDMDGSDSFYGPITLVYQGGNEPGIPSIPQVTELKSIYPNPFNPSTTISYGLAEAADVKVQIFNSRGQLVRSISEGQRNAGNYNLIWNGTDNNGQSQPTGVYFVRLHAGKKVFNSKAVLMK